MLIMGFICLLGKWPNATSPGKQHKVINMSTTTTFRNSSIKKEVFMMFFLSLCVFQWVYWYYICPSRHLGTTRKRRKWNGADQRNQIGLWLNISYTKCVCYIGYRKRDACIVVHDRLCEIFLVLKLPPKYDKSCPLLFFFKFKRVSKVLRRRIKIQEVLYWFSLYYAPFHREAY